MKNTDSKIVEKEKIVAEMLNGRFAMIGFVVKSFLVLSKKVPQIYPKNLIEIKFGSFFVY